MAKAKLKSFRFKTVKVPSIQEPILSEDERDELGQFKYPWHNIVFEGGGNKGLAYAGSVRVGYYYTNHYVLSWSNKLNKL